MTLYDQLKDNAEDGSEEGKSESIPAPIEQLKGTNLKEIPRKDV